ncbi:hypothetical protein L7F22_030133 [Adiantum nelumboides]|nr:hypothetical protein [Adiantum nelumboides]
MLFGEFPKIKWLRSFRDPIIADEETEVENTPKPDLFSKVRTRCEAPRRESQYMANYAPCRYVRLSCLRGNPIAIYSVQLIGISMPGLEPEFQPLVEHLLPHVISSKHELQDLYLQLLGEIMTRLSTFITYLEGDLTLYCENAESTLRFLAMLAGPFYPILIAIDERERLKNIATANDSESSKGAQVSLFTVSSNFQGVVPSTWVQFKQVFALAWIINTFEVDVMTTWNQLSGVNCECLEEYLPKGIEKYCTKTSVMNMAQLMENAEVVDDLIQGKSDEDRFETRRKEPKGKNFQPKAMSLTTRLTVPPFKKNPFTGRNVPFEIVEGGKKIPPILQTKDKIFETDKYVQNTDEAYRKIKLVLEKTQSKRKKAVDRHILNLYFHLVTGYFYALKSDQSLVEETVAPEMEIGCPSSIHPIVEEHFRLASSPIRSSSYLASIGFLSQWKGPIFIGRDTPSLRSRFSPLDSVSDVRTEDRVVFQLMFAIEALLESIRVPVLDLEELCRTHPPSVVMWSIRDAAAIFGTQEDRLRTWAQEMVSGICRGFSVPWAPPRRSRSPAPSQQSSGQLVAFRPDVALLLLRAAFRDHALGTVAKVFGKISLSVSTGGMIGVRSDVLPGSGQFGSGYENTVSNTELPTHNFQHSDYSSIFGDDYFVLEDDAGETGLSPLLDIASIEEGLLHFLYASITKPLLYRRLAEMKPDLVPVLPYIQAVLPAIRPASVGILDQLDEGFNPWQAPLVQRAFSQVVALATTVSYKPLLDSCAGYLSSFSLAHEKAACILIDLCSGPLAPWLPVVVAKVDLSFELVEGILGSFQVVDRGVSFARAALVYVILGLSGHIDESLTVYKAVKHNIIFFIEMLEPFLLPAITPIKNTIAFGDVSAVLTEKQERDCSLALDIIRTAIKKPAVLSALEVEWRKGVVKPRCSRDHFLSFM